MSLAPNVYRVPLLVIHCPDIVSERIGIETPVFQFRAERHRRCGARSSRKFTVYRRVEVELIVKVLRPSLIQTLNVRNRYGPPVAHGSRAVLDKPQRLDDANRLAVPLLFSRGNPCACTRLT